MHQAVQDDSPDFNFISPYEFNQGGTYVLHAGIK